MKVEVAVLSLTVLMVSVDLKQHLKKKKTLSQSSGAVCESRGGRPGLPVPNGLCGLEATSEEDQV